VATMGGLVQINPVWLYGPFHASEVPSPAQPDWWLGWVEGALRIFPPWEPRAFGYEIPNPFFPGVLVPGVTFGALYLWPFLEARFTGDREPHHLLDRARDHPVRTAVGVGALSFFVLLQVAASNDLLAHWMYASVATISWTFRIVVPLLPLLIGFLTHRLMRALQQSGRERLAELPLSDVLRPAAERAGVVASPDGQEGDGARLHLERGADGRWRWRYLDPGRDVELCSNKSYDSAEAARDSAASAYPGTDFDETVPAGAELVE
jgi:ubiquinol-cytochrome c reductase cytochrome b subunit